MGSSPTRPKKVTFDPAVQFERTSGNQRPKRAMTAEITTEIFREFEAKDVTDTVLTEAALLFSENHGVWDTPNGHPGPARGTRVRMSGRRLRKDHLPEGARSS
ncbi:hypothetical protein B0T18DRAFT_209921 [Schizothecium vesticola]|uniref:Uncharacterized protein n=1 Tax=Schizothecium vesticola TaxID=314040 RepID=A0AA40EJJ5_9PEZI|nr:hypothetical protein B0T18DRAFT_209921 [Schizothecium vesticola]